MKIKIGTLALLFLALLSARAFSADLGLVRMGIVQGDVQVYTEDARDWVPAGINTPLTEGDRVWVPDGGRSELQVLGGLFVRLDEATSFDILSLRDNAYEFSLNAGRAYVNNSRSDISQVLIDTPVSTVIFEDSATAMIDVSDTGATEISVLEGTVYADTEKGRIRIVAGRTLEIGADLRTAFYQLNPSDEWEAWNRNLDRGISEYDTSSRYLPEELDTYSHDFDANGRWLYDSSYGYVWTPAVSVSLDWAPYHDGRWVWIGGNYVWISSERWGWAPYHYGRWIFLRHGGWCWVPPKRGAVYWGPGYVGWVTTPNYVSWVPLAPGETYYGHGYYGPGSVNISANTTIPAHRNYLNRNARNAIKVEHRDTFLHGRKVAVSPRENPFNERNAGIGPPRFRPDRETYSPVLKKVPETKLPPRRIRTISPEALRKERRTAPDRRGAPVISPPGPTREQPSPSRENPKRIIREQRPDIYTDRLPNRETRQPEQKGQMRRELPTDRIEPAPLFTPATPKGSRGETAPTGVRQQRQPDTLRVAPQPVTPRQHEPATIKTEPRQAAPRQRQPSTNRVAPQPVAPQPVAPTPVWSPSTPRVQEQRRSPASQLPQRAPVTIQRAIPAAPHSPAPAEQPRQMQKAPERVYQQAPQFNRQTAPIAPQGQGAPNLERPRQKPPEAVRQGSQTIQPQKPVAAQPIINQAPASLPAAPAIIPESRQQRGNFGERPAFQRGEGRGENR